MDFFNLPDITSIWDIANYAVWVVVILVVVWARRANTRAAAQLQALKNENTQIRAKTQEFTAMMTMMQSTVAAITAPLAQVVTAVQSNTTQDIKSYNRLCEIVTLLSADATAQAIDRETLEAVSVGVAAFGGKLDARDSDMQKDIRNDVQQAIAKLEEVGRHIIAAVNTSQSANSKQHVEIQTELSNALHILHDIKALVQPPEPKPPNVEPLIQLNPNPEDKPKAEEERKAS